jgi:DNA-binding MurR/RpiR family transcriptional regulator
MYGLRDRLNSQSTQNELIARAQQVFAAGLDVTFASIPAGEFEEIVKLIANPKRRIWTVGGRFTELLAEYLTLHLKLMRREVQAIGSSEFDRANALIDFTPRDVLLAFDFRRYQPSTIDFVQRAKKQRVTTVLFTDPWLSPAAQHSDHLLSCSVIAPSPFDSLTSGMALVETVIAGVVEELGAQPRQRVSAFDEFLSPTEQT